MSALKLLAKDDQDLQLVAAVVQDSIAPVSEMTFRESEKSFVMVVHRFRWDCVPQEEGCYERIASALDIQGVTAVQYTGFDPTDAALMLDLLTLKFEESSLQALFAGGGTLRLKIGSNWSLKLEDFGESWPTKRLPSHMS